MRIEKIHVSNFRCLEDCEIDCHGLTILVGPNGAGKSTFLRALEIFFNVAAKYDERDFYDSDTSRSIVISLTFCDLSQGETERFNKYLLGNRLTVEKELTYPVERGSQRYYGKTMSNPDFSATRLAPSANDMKSRFQELVSSGKYPGLDPLAGRPTMDQIRQSLDAWEAKNTDKLVRTRDAGQFFGFKEVGTARLERSVRYLYVPAVADPKIDGQDAKGTVVADLIDILMRETLANSAEMNKVQREFQERMQGMVGAEYVEQLNGLARELSSSVAEFAPGSEVKLDWLPPDEIDVPIPRTNVRIVEEGYPSPLETSGDGVQRAFLMAVLQRYQYAQASRAEGASESYMNGSAKAIERSEGVPLMLLGIEEPELYQHPSRQRHIARMLKEIAENQSRAQGQVQIIYTTHSPLLVDLERYHQTRLVRRVCSNTDRPRCTRVFSATFADVTKKLEKAYDAQEGEFQTNSEKARAQTLMTPWINEGFFSDVAVLVEGEEDRAILLGAAMARDVNLDAQNISVLPCSGKSQVVKAATIFGALGVKTYVIWDSDEGSDNPHVEHNRALLRMHGNPAQDYPATTVAQEFACFKKNFMSAIIPELQGFEKARDEAVAFYDIGTWEKGRKNPLVLSRILGRLLEGKARETTVDRILVQIVKRKTQVLL